MTESSAPSATKWEYRFLVKQTDRQMLLELNHIGREGWEALGLSYDKDLKGVMNWTCWLKRPCGAATLETHAATAATAAPAETAASAPAGDAAPADGTAPAGGFDLSDGDFNLKD